MGDRDATVIRRANLGRCLRDVEPLETVMMKINMLVRKVMMDFRVEEKNPLGEANRVILAFSAEIYAPKVKRSPRRERLFRRYYVYDERFGPDEMKTVLLDILSDFSKTVTEMNRPPRMMPIKIHTPEPLPPLTKPEPVRLPPRKPPKKKAPPATK
jgi:hypothetical protein